MVLNNIEKLLEKYENGDTSLTEEQALKNYFNSSKVAPHLEIYKPLFNYFSVNHQEQFTKQVPLKRKLAFSYKWVAAAVIAIMLGFYLKTPLATTYKEYAYGTYDNPKEALHEIEKSLAVISSQFNKGVSTINYLEEINKGTATLGYLNEIENSTSIIFKK